MIEDRLERFEKEHQERIKQYSVEEQKQALKNLVGCFSQLKDTDFREIKREAILR